ncbi:uncharacterized protein B0T23DRAFT_227690 [Neurospora hispaniola]|uniref:Secreted protein n=1 Tax=Neurospora hispaniola TaxID=588809 RepID=A0AAJ0MMY7_9PEZI|nr:hypothetical protein B0T23DRAFT_227690 [Neurospora hispaniola]
MYTVMALAFQLISVKFPKACHGSCPACTMLYEVVLYTCAHSLGQASTSDTGTGSPSQTSMQRNLIKTQNA